MHRSPEPQSRELLHGVATLHSVQPAQQNVSPSIVGLHRQNGPQTSLPHETFEVPHDHAQVSGDAAAAGVLRLDSTGTVHTTPAPTPIRFSAVRREIPSRKIP